jgi:hypothetical protein
VGSGVPGGAGSDSVGGTSVGGGTVGGSVSVGGDTVGGSVFVGGGWVEVGGGCVALGGTGVSAGGRSVEIGVCLMPGAVGDMVVVGVGVNPVTGMLLSDLIASANSEKCVVAPHNMDRSS